jgi:hypothetical protein
MRRAVGVTIVVLLSVAVLQFIAMRRMRIEIGRLRAEAGAYAVETRRDEIARTGQWLHAWLQAPDGGAREQGLCPGGQPDVSTIGTLVFETYLRARAAGASEVDARHAVMNRVRETKPQARQ